MDNKINREFIRRMCIEANPALIKWKSPHKDVIDFINKGSGNFSYSISCRHIRLADILLAIKNESIFVRSGGEFCKWDEGEDIYWNLYEDDLEKQTDETINFLTELLKKKESQ